MAAPQITTQDIAEKAGVDIQDVAKVMFHQDGVDRLIRNRILQAMDELGYPWMPKRDTSRHKMLGVIVAGIVNEYINTVVSNIAEATREAQISMKVFAPQDDFQEEMSIFLSDPDMFAVLLLSPNNYAETLNFLRQYDLPVASFSYRGGVDLSDVLLLQIDNHNSIMAAMNHLVELNHRRIGFVTGLMDHHDAVERLDGYRAALEAHDLPYDESLVYTGNFMADSGFDAGMALLQCDSPPTAIVASSDMMAVGVLRAAQRLGLRPGEDFSIVGFDDVALAAQFSLTTLAPPFGNMALEAIKGLGQMADGELLEHHQQRFVADLIVRESTRVCAQS